MLRTYVISIILSLCLRCTYVAGNCINPPLANSDSCIKEKLMVDYEKTARPRPTTTDPLSIKMDYIVRGFEYDDSLLSIYLWLKMSWADPNFQWLPADYNNVKYIKISSGDIWIPDLAIYNAKNDIGINSCAEVYCLIEYTGIVRCSPPCTHEAICNSNLKQWPFDRQKCTIDIGSWLHDKSDLLFKQEEISLNQQLSFENKEWKLISSKYLTGIYNKTSQGSDILIETSIISYEFVIERHSILQQILLVTPSIIMILINLIAMWVELFNSDRLYLLLLNILLHFMVIEELFWYTPFSGDYVPDVIFYVRDSLIVTAIELFITILLRAISRYMITPPIWIETTNNLFINNPLGFYFIVAGNQEKGLNNSLGDDDQHLVEPKSYEVSKENTKWKQFAKISDRIIFMIVSLAYAILVFRMLPSGYEKL